MYWRLAVHISIQNMRARIQQVLDDLGPIRHYRPVQAARLAVVLQGGSVGQCVSAQFERVVIFFALQLMCGY